MINRFTKKKKRGMHGVVVVYCHTIQLSGIPYMSQSLVGGPILPSIHLCMSPYRKQTMHGRGSNAKHETAEARLSHIKHFHAPIRVSLD